MSFSSSIFIALSLFLLSGSTFSISNSHEITNSSSCPLNFNLLQKLSGFRSSFVDVQTHCHYLHQGMRLIRSEYLRTHGHFLPPSATSEACWVLYRSLVSRLVHDFDIKSSCGYHPDWISHACKNVTMRSQFEKLIPEPELDQVRTHCNGSLQNFSHCSLCTSSLMSLQVYLGGPENGNFSDCTGYPYIYTAAFVNQFGPTDKYTAKCLFSLHLSPSSTANSPPHIFAISGAMMGLLVGIFGAIMAVALLLRRHKKIEEEKKSSGKIATSFVSWVESIKGSSNLVKYKFEEIKSATMNFSRENIIGKGQYGYVYRGTLQDGSEVAVKKIKNCSLAGDRTFAHEVEVVASVTHVNLVALRGYCTATDPLQGHQRMIVCDLMCNGSLYDHLFGPDSLPHNRLSWPNRQKIALGTARGLAYLHHGTQPAIIHRDIKASNILLDETFEPRVADFGLAKFNSNVATHLSTRVAGTLGYLAPEYALYGKLTEGSDVYSFGVVLLELLSGKKAVISGDGGKTSHLTDWAWSLVRKGRAMDVVEENMPGMGLPEAMEQCVVIAVHACHPHLHARPTMDQIVKLLEANMPIPLVSEASVASSKAVCCQLMKIENLKDEPVHETSATTGSKECKIDVHNTPFNL
ncbi:hypothetical protein ACSBR1_005360 [Camellia fascicularis]